MPELPDVQVFKEYVDATSLHQRIRRVEIAAPALLEDVSIRTVRRKLQGHELRSTRRHGKHLFIRVTSDGWLRLHFGMTGELRYFHGDGDPPAHTRLRIDFTKDRHLAYVNQRKFGHIGVAEDVDEFVRARGLGPDALALDLKGFRRALAGHRGAIKNVLMDQSVIAGLGNVYTDEMLFRAGVAPETSADELDAGAQRTLHRAMGWVLRHAIGARVEVERMPRSFLLPHREGDGKCPRCGEKLRRDRIGGRTTYWCPRDQSRGS